MLDIINGQAVSKCLEALDVVGNQTKGDMKFSSGIGPLDYGDTSAFFGGLERIIEIDLDEDEQKAFDASVEHVRTLVSQIDL